MDIYEKILEAEKQGRPFAVATIVKAIGCTPRTPGTKMIIYDDGSFEGTIGGGDAERQCIEDALEALRSGVPQLNIYSPQTLAAKGAEPECKKNIQVFIEPSKADSILYLLGGGHVAQAVLPVAKQLGFKVIVYDVRDLTPFLSDLAGADEIRHVDRYGDLKQERLVSNSAILVCTHSHATDAEAALAVVDKSYYYLGMLGAKHKFVPIFRQMLAAGVPMEKVRSIYAPTGLDIGGESPEAIAIGIMAEISAMKNGKTGRSLRDVKHAHIFAELEEEFGK